MRMLSLIFLVLGLVSSGCSSAEVRCPSTSSEAIDLLKKGGFTGELRADIDFMGRGAGHCFFRYEYVFGQSGRMSSRLIVFSEDGYEGSYAFAFNDLKVDGDRLSIALPSGAKESILLRDIGSKLLIDGEPLTFYK